MLKIPKTPPWCLTTNESEDPWAATLTPNVAFKNPSLGFPGGAVVKNPPANAGDTGSSSGATKPVQHNYWACALEPTSHNYWARVPQLLKPVPRACAPQQEKPPQWEAHAPQQSSPRSLQLEEAHAQQWRPKADKN